MRPTHRYFSFGHCLLAFTPVLLQLSRLLHLLLSVITRFGWLNTLLRFYKLIEREVSKQINLAKLFDYSPEI